MYAVLGMNLFTYLALDGDINEDRNFVSFGNACLLLFQCLTGDGWSSMMDDAMITPERGCDPHPEDGSPSDCGSPLALPYFMSFVVIATFVFLNLVVAVILENFTALGSTNPDLVSANDIADFKDEWGLYDPDANGWIDAKDLPNLVMNLKAPLGLKNTSMLSGPNPRGKALRFCLSLGLKASGGGVQFRDVLDALIQKNYAEKKVDTGPTPGSPGPGTPGPASPGPGTPVPGSYRGPLTPRTREMSKIYADELLEGFISRKRAETAPGEKIFNPAAAGIQKAAAARKSPDKMALPPSLLGVMAGQKELVPSPGIPAAATPSPEPVATPPPLAATPSPLVKKKGEGAGAARKPAAVKSPPPSRSPPPSKSPLPSKSPPSKPKPGSSPPKRTSAVVAGAGAKPRDDAQLPPPQQMPPPAAAAGRKSP